MGIIIIYEAETLSSLTQAKFLHNRVTTSFQLMVHGWLVGLPLASGVCVGWWEGVDKKEVEEEDGGAQKENPKIDIIQLSSLTFLNIQSVEYFGKEKTPPQLVYN